MLGTSKAGALTGLQSKDRLDGGLGRVLLTGSPIALATQGTPSRTTAPPKFVSLQDT